MRTEMFIRKTMSSENGETTQNAFITVLKIKLEVPQFLLVQGTLVYGDFHCYLFCVWLSSPRRLLRVRHD